MPVHYDDAVVSAIAALDEVGARVYMHAGTYRAELPLPSRADGHAGLGRAYISIYAGDLPGTVHLYADLPDGDSLLEKEDARPGDVVAYWRDATEAARDAAHRVADEAVIRRDARLIAKGVWEDTCAGYAAAAEDPADPVPGDKVALRLPGGTTLIRAYTGASRACPTGWEWRSHGCMARADGQVLADLADDPVVRLPRTMVAVVLDGPARRERHAARLAEETADAVERAAGDDRPRWERELLREHGPDTAPATAEEAVNAALDANDEETAAGGEEVRLTISPTADGDYWVPALQGPGGVLPLSARLTGTMPAWAGPAQIRAWLGALFGDRAAAGAELAAACPFD